jgi:hypothetical protein
MALASIDIVSKVFRVWVKVIPVVPLVLDLVTYQETYHLGVFFPVIPLHAFLGGYHHGFSPSLESNIGSCSIIHPPLWVDIDV